MMKYKIVQATREASQDLAETKMVRSFQANMKKAIEDMTTVLKAQAIREANQVSKLAQIIFSLHTLKLHLIDIFQGNL